jgi:hypothetical protein
LVTQQPAADERRGGAAVADVTGGGLLDFLYSTPGALGAYDHWGNKMWVLTEDIWLTGTAENEGLPGLHHPGFQAADIDGDGKTEVIFLTGDGKLHIVDGATGKSKRVAQPPVPDQAARWEHVMVANLRGKGDRDIILQACPSTGPDSRRGLKRGSLMAAFAGDKLEGPPLWQTDRYWGLAHGPARIADMDDDGRDEVAGVTFIDHDGKFVQTWAYPPISKDIAGGASFHIDSLFICDVRPEIPGLEAVLLEEGRNYVALVNMKRGILWHKAGPQREEPQNAAVGDFDPTRPGLEIWCRSRRNIDQTPWVFDSRGNVIAEWKMTEKAPSDWTHRGVEEISVIDWDGSGPRFCAAKERHKQGDICIFDPITGEFIRRWKETAARLLVADVAGDSREELVVVSGSEIHIYSNDRPNPHPRRPRYWAQQHYRRSKASWNYYSP